MYSVPEMKTNDTHIAYQNNFTAALLVLAVFLFESATSLFLPSLPSIQDFFKVSAQHVQNTLSAYLLGFALLGIIAGPISDAVGRRPLMIFGLILFLAGSFFSYVFANESLNMLILSRFFQGLGAGVATVLVFATLKDMFDDLKCAQMMSLMGIIIATAPMISPLIGGTIAEISHWMTLFSIMLGGALLVFVVYFFMGRETLIHKKNLNLPSILKNYRVLFSHKSVMGYIIISTLLYGALFAWIVHAPFFFCAVFHLSTLEYALFAACGPIFYMIGAFINYILLPRMGIPSMIVVGLVAASVGALCVLVLSLSQTPSLGLYLGAFLAFNAGLAPVFSNAGTMAISMSEDNRGSASALLAAFEQAFAAFTTFLVGLGSAQSILPASMIMVIAMVVASGIFIRIRKIPKQAEVDFSKAV